MDNVSIGRAHHTNAPARVGRGSRRKQQQQTNSLGDLNRQLGIADESFLWNEWLWGCDALQECSMDIMLNRMHLIGLLLARSRSHQIRVNDDKTLLQLFFAEGDRFILRQLCLFDNVPVAKYSMRQLLDSLQNVQMMWCRFHVPMISRARQAVDALFCRFGRLADMQEPDHMYDDIGSMDAEKKRLSKLCIRKMTNTFLILYRHLHCWTHHQSHAHSQHEIYDCGIKMHHILAASDDFTTLSMHWDLIPSARLNYQHDFRGLYNCVSQVKLVCPHLNLFFVSEP